MRDTSVQVLKRPITKGRIGQSCPKTQREPVAMLLRLRLRGRRRPVPMLGCNHSCCCRLKNYGCD